MPPIDWNKFFLEQKPEAAFLGAGAGFATSPLRRRFLQSQFENVFKQYMGGLGQQAIAGRLPERPQLFGDFMRNFDFNRLFSQQPRVARGASSGFFNPRTRFLFGF